MTNLHSGTLMKERMSKLREILVRNVMGDIWDNEPDNLWCWDECQALWWKPLLLSIVLGAHFTTSPLLVHTSTSITQSTLQDLYETDPEDMREFMTSNDCIRYSPASNGHEAAHVPYIPNSSNMLLLRQCTQRIEKLLPTITVGNPMGRGGYATVWKGWYTEDTEKKPVALKVGLSSAARFSLKHELEVLRRIGDHPSIVKPVHGNVFAGPDGLGVLVLPYYTDGHLSTSGYYWCADRIQRLIQQISAALDVVHAANFMHLDVSMGNILMDGDRFGLTDFGKSQFKSVESKWTSTAFGPNHETGTPFESPLIFERATQTHIVDWHSLSFVVYALVHRHLPWNTSRDPVHTTKLKHDLISQCELGVIDCIPELLVYKLRGNVHCDVQHSIQQNRFCSCTGST